MDSMRMITGAIIRRPRVSGLGRSHSFSAKIFEFSGKQMGFVDVRSYFISVYCEFIRVLMDRIQELSRSKTRLRILSAGFRVRLNIVGFSSAGSIGGSVNSDRTGLNIINDR
jgi:hypothetical protein